MKLTQREMSYIESFKKSDQLSTSVVVESVKPSFEIKGARERILVELETEKIKEEERVIAEKKQQLLLEHQQAQATNQREHDRIERLRQEEINKARLAEELVMVKEIIEQDIINEVSSSLDLLSCDIETPPVESQSIPLDVVSLREDKHIISEEELKDVLITLDALDIVQEPVIEESPVEKEVAIDDSKEEIEILEFLSRDGFHEIVEEKEEIVGEEIVETIKDHGADFINALTSHLATESFDVEEEDEEEIVEEEDEEEDRVKRVESRIEIVEEEDEEEIVEEEDEEEIVEEEDEEEIVEEEEVIITDTTPDDEITRIEASSKKIYHLQETPKWTVLPQQSWDQNAYRQRIQFIAAKSREVAYRQEKFQQTMPYSKGAGGVHQTSEWGPARWGNKDIFESGDGNTVLFDCDGKRATSLAPVMYDCGTGFLLDLKGRPKVRHM